jgi:hypothetical protein
MKKAWWTALFFCAAACLVSLCLGQDNNYDLKGYHLYNAWAVVADRWSQDLFAAGAHTYLSPFLDVPYYLAATRLLPLHGVWLVALAGIPYGVLLHLIYLISSKIARSLELGKWDRIGFIAACVVVAGTGAAVGSEIGTTFNDVTIAAIVLAAFYQVLPELADGGAQPSLRRIGASAGLLGLAMGLKLTAGVYVASMGVVIFFLAHGWRKKVASLLVYGCCVSVIFAAVYGPWAWKLHELTGNPFFPFFNGVFHSDWIASVNVRDDRFFPRSLAQWLFYPFYWTTLQSSLVTEVPFRDPRMALAYVFVAAYLGLSLLGRELKARVLPGNYRPVHVLVSFLGISYVVWLQEFSILRYLVATECLAGIFVITATMAAVRRLGRRASWLPGVCAISAAILIATYTVHPQWGRSPIGTDILAVQAPVLERGALVIFSDAPMSFLAPGLAATSQGLSFMSIPRTFHSGGRLGAYGMEHELMRHMQAKIAANAGPLYVLFHESQPPPGANLAAFGIEMDMTTCQPGRSALGSQFLACRAVPLKFPAAPSR